MSEEQRSNHVVVLGDSRVARAVAEQRRRSEDVVHLSGDARNPSSLIEETGAGQARLVFIDLVEDAATVAALAELIERTSDGGRPAILANIRDAALRRYVDDNLLARHIRPRPRVFSSAALTAAAVVAQARPHDLAHWRGQSRIHAAVIGFSKLGRACFEELVTASIVGEFGLPRVTIIDPEPAIVRRVLKRDMPELGVSAEVEVEELDPLTLTSHEGPIAKAEAELPLTLIVVALDPPALALDIVTSVARMQEQEGEAVAAVALVTEGQSSLYELAKPAGRPRDLGRTWAVYGGIESDADIIDLVTRRADLLAERIHVAYCDGFPGTGPANAPWDLLSESYRRANRQAAEHLPLKLWTLGLIESRGSRDPFAVHPHTCENVIRPISQSASEDNILRRLSRIEHDRWCAERRLNGWRYGEVRDDGRRIHPKLVPFDDPRFTDQDIEKDADQVRFLFANVVVAAEDGLVSPLVLGVLVGPHAAAGIDVPAAVALAEREPWRPIVVLSALLDETECRLLRALDRELERRGRTDWRLVVPEVSRDNKELRVVIEPEHRELVRAFLGRPSTRFAPLGGRMIAAADLWADPSAPDPHAELIAQYVTARASAIIDDGGSAPVAAGSSG